MICTQKYFLQTYTTFLYDFCTSKHQLQKIAFVNLIVKDLIDSLGCFIPMIDFFMSFVLFNHSLKSFYFHRLSTLLSSVTRWEFSEILSFRNKCQSQTCHGYSFTYQRHHSRTFFVLSGMIQTIQDPNLEHLS